MAVNGRHALEMLWESSYDLVLMDIQMPEMDGLTATRLIRSDERYAGLPIIAMTAHAMQGDREKSLEAGMNEHLTKPISPEILEETLNSFLENPRSSYKPVGLYEIEIDIDLPEISGIDSLRGLKNMGGNRKGYLRVLQGFKDDYGNFASELRDIVEKSDFEQAGIVLHSLKGVAGNIGAFRLYELCRILESDARDEDSVNFEADFNLFSTELEMIIEGLDGVQTQSVIKRRNYVYDQEKSFSIINKLYKMLGEGDAESYDVLEELRTYFNPEQFEKSLEELTIKVENFDFDEGCVILEKIAAELGVSLIKR